MFTHAARGRTRALPFAPLVLLLGVIGLVVLPANGTTEPTSSTGSRLSPEFGVSAELPVTAVNLFTSGVGYFQHDGFVEGDADVTLTFSAADMNDLLKSLILQDFDGGSVEAVTYPSQDPLSRILESFSLDIADNPSLAELIHRARGARVSVEGAVSADGTIFGVETRLRRTDAGSDEEPVLNLLTADGLRQVSFAGMRSIRFTDPVLQQELDAALSVVAGNRRQDRRAVTIRFTGVGRRRVRIGYVRAVPVWKTSYRIVLADDGRARIQGWAIVENTGEVDWNDVSLGLVSGQPVSFVMDLYSPIYTTRPRVQPQFGVTVAPQQYDRDIAPQAAPPRSLARAAEASGMESLADAGGFANAVRPAPIDLSQGVVPAATMESGAVYRVDHPVSIPRRGAALIPIVSELIPARRLAVYDASVLRDRPLAAVRLENATDLHLPAGPATIFDGANYAGDARLPELVAGENRLVSYAVDLHSALVVRSSPSPERITRVRIVNGVLDVTMMDRLTTEYVVARLGDESMLHLVVHPKRSGWEIVGESQPVGETSGSLRFEVDAAAGATQTLTVVEERVRSQQIGLTAIRDDQIIFYLDQREIDESSARALRQIRTLRGIVAEREQTRRGFEQEFAAIYREQERIRSNLAVLERDTDLYRRYLETLTSQEDQIAALQERLRTARAAEEAARSSLRDYIESL